MQDRKYGWSALFIQMMLFCILNELRIFLKKNTFKDNNYNHNSNNNNNNNNNSNNNNNYKNKNIDIVNEMKIII